jgi:phage host-nuclease inhibitor protein Gam
MSSIKRDSTRGQILMALRAGPMDSEQARLRWGNYSGNDFTALVAEGFVRRTPGGSYLITDEGLKVCPNRRKSESTSSKPTTKENCVMARVRVPGNTLQSWSDVDQALSKIGEIDRELALLEASQQEQIDRIKASIKACAEPFQSKKAVLEQSVQLYAENNQAEFRTSKTKVLTFGSVGFRLSTKVTFKRGVDVVQALKDLGLAHCIRVKEEADKEAMKNLPAETLAECGASLRTEDTFGYEINREKLAEAA